MISSMDEITVLLKCNNNNDASTVTQGLTGQTDRTDGSEEELASQQRSKSASLSEKH